MNKIMCAIGNKIKELRKKSALTQEELATLIEVDPKYISRIETGNSTPSLKTLIKISEILKTDLEEFFQIETSEKKTKLIEMINLRLNKANLKELNAILEITSCLVD